MLEPMKKEDIEHLASLARIRLEEAEKDSLGKELSSIVEYVSTVSEIVAEDIDDKPQVGAVYNVFRADEVTNEADEYTKDILNEMPALDGRYLKVKKILKME